MPKRHNNTIRKQFFRSKTIKAILSSITRIRLTIYIEDPKKTFSINCTHVKDTKAEETTIINIITTSHPERSLSLKILSLSTSRTIIESNGLIKPILQLYINQRLYLTF